MFCFQKTVLRKKKMELSKAEEEFLSLISKSWKQIEGMGLLVETSWAVRNDESVNSEMQWAQNSFPAILPWSAAWIKRRHCNRIL